MWGARMRARVRSGTVLLAAVAGISSLGVSPAAAITNGWPHTAVSGVSTPSGGGFWVAYSNGDVSARGNVGRYGDASNLELHDSMIGGTSTPNGRGYWLVGADGGIFTYGNAHYFGSTAGRDLNRPVLSMIPTKNGKGYWLVARDGGVFTFGNARFYGSAASLSLAQPIVGATTSPSGRGYRMVGRDGGIFSFGDVPYHGSLPGRGVHVTDVVGIATASPNTGYWVARSNGQVYAFGRARTLGSYAPVACNPVTAIFSNPNAEGYRLVTKSGATVPFGKAPGGNYPTGNPQQCPAPPPPLLIPMSPASAFNDGHYTVGSDFPAGTYRTISKMAGCYWERESGFSGNTDDIIANGFTNVGAIVTISETDKSFKASGCGTWTNDLSRITSSKTAPFPPGVYIVGTDIAAGTWRSSLGSGCYWQRDSDFSGTSAAIIAMGFTHSRVIVTIAHSDRGFKATENCGTWTKIG